MQRRLIHLGGGLAVAVALASGAQAESSVQSSPADHEPAATRPAAAGVQPEARALPVYRSPLSEYRPYRIDEPLRPWKEANDEVGRLGGHMGHLERPAGGGAR